MKTVVKGLKGAVNFGVTMGDYSDHNENYDNKGNALLSAIDEKVKDGNANIGIEFGIDEISLEYEASEFKDALCLIKDLVKSEVTDKIKKVKKSKKHETSEPAEVVVIDGEEFYRTVDSNNNVTLTSRNKEV